MNYEGDNLFLSRLFLFGELTSLSCITVAQTEMKKRKERWVGNSYKVMCLDVLPTSPCFVPS